MLLFNALSVYGLIYAAGFIVFALVKHPFLQAGSLAYRFFIALYTAIAVIVGGRLFYALIYEPVYYINNPVEILELYKGGMSFHGALVLCIVMIYVLDREAFLKNLDRSALTAMLLLPAGRVVNFLNGELYGRPSSLPFAFIFEGGGEIPRPPSQLYEAIAEGPLIALVIFILYRMGVE